MKLVDKSTVTPCVGVWIETTVEALQAAVPSVTPCVGVWIETSSIGRVVIIAGVTPCVGVWIETRIDMLAHKRIKVTPCVGVWIETKRLDYNTTHVASHPAWVCGLKLNEHCPDSLELGHTLRGCVD